MNRTRILKSIVTNIGLETILKSTIKDDNTSKLDVYKAKQLLKKLEEHTLYLAKQLARSKQ